MLLVMFLVGFAVGVCVAIIGQWAVWLCDHLCR